MGELLHGIWTTMTNRCWPGHATENGNQRTSSEKYGKRERSDSKLRFGYSQQLAKTSSLDAEVRRLHQTRMAQKNIRQARHVRSDFEQIVVKPAAIEPRPAICGRACGVFSATVLVWFLKSSWPGHGTYGSDVACRALDHVRKSVAIGDHRCF